MDGLLLVLEADARSLARAGEWGDVEGLGADGGSTHELGRTSIASFRGLADHRLLVSSRPRDNRLPIAVLEARNDARSVARASASHIGVVRW